jgi:hypothetical protein
MGEQFTLMVPLDLLANPNSGLDIVIKKENVSPKKGRFRGVFYWASIVGVNISANPLLM